MGLVSHIAGIESCYHFRITGEIEIPSRGHASAGHYATKSEGYWRHSKVAELVDAPVDMITAGIEIELVSKIIVQVRVLPLLLWIINSQAPLRVTGAFN